MLQKSLPSMFSLSEQTPLRLSCAVSLHAVATSESQLRASPEHAQRLVAKVLQSRREKMWGEAYIFSVCVCLRHSRSCILLSLTDR